MKNSDLPENPYLLLTPGPLSTSKTVKATMLRDWCTWDDDYNLNVVQQVRTQLETLASANASKFTSVLMQGSGTFAVEATLGTVVPVNGKLLIIANGAYGMRMIKIAQMLHMAHIPYIVPETETPDVNEILLLFEQHTDITHLAMVHCETTTGILNPVKEICKIAKQHNIATIVDAMSSFGGYPIDMQEWGIDFLISSANKCIQGVPGFGFVIALKNKLEQCAGQARSHALDLYDQWKTMDLGKGKWRFTSPTHVVRAFQQALSELATEGGIAARYKRYSTNQQMLVKGMRRLGFETLLPDNLQSPIITSFLSPTASKYSFIRFYELLKAEGFIIYPGKVAESDTFRIGNIGEIYPEHIESLVKTIERIKYW